MNRHKKQEHFKKFNELYFNGDSRSFKIHALPYWIDNYAYWLNKEQNNQLPKYYNKFSQGKIVYIDFGVRIGSEISGPHFGIVLNKEDSKYKRTVTIVPLTSKEKPYYVALEKEFILNIYHFALSKADRISQKMDRLEKNFDSVIADFHNETSTVEYNESDSKFLANHASIYFPELQQNKLYLNIQFHDSSTTIDPNEQLKKFSKAMLSHPDISDHPELKKTVELVNSYLEKADSFAKQVKEAKELASKLKELGQKLEKYNKNSFVDIQNITTISKLRIKSFSEFGISENTSISPESLEKIHTALFNQI
ncbi:type II toxin-antitoxin system PemK/MazF family toxin [Latilactobacillus curvatus]|uniref:type II toxin-antitoxin system PemK/MazF family toxin n=1 Tax=Latilactobacillus curvatus TaxID=28038 RepID=UPI002074801A|nr:type II toxin-antitoxin system PemK/MazF family toxin [Latilactobacillus curvatus]MCM6845032.1 type II toxin-antitoxin system PemK/MazF family toxin [Latilactobacillus curvatus]MCM6862064.1 type II toxin-antitoxin system PemK/MazF family toxin [Latilactobacillus curvatus]MCM6869508.1 type II toxin-antitoxin system PemK/MazF family toxin [Latilactobacillus curvatus]MDG2983964.1 type II toxin-antitoxin system PemK/MazF family toxin [Latilactobacillus curvatus]